MYAFPANLINALRCRVDRGALRLADTLLPGQDAVQDGTLVCERCAARYPVTGGIVRLLPAEAVETLPATARAEIQARDRQAAGYDARLAERAERELPTTLAAIGDVADRRVVEYGCGTGRLSVHLAVAREVLAIDFSFASLQVLAAKLAQAGIRTVGLVEADITDVALAPDRFDCAVSTQVLEHLTPLGRRLGFLFAVRASLAVGGRFICTAYHYDWRRRLARRPREGTHGSGIFYRYFTQRELRALFRAPFGTVRCRYIDITLPLASRLAARAGRAGKLSRALEKVAPANRLAHLAMVVATKETAGIRYSARFLWRRKWWVWFEQPAALRGAAALNVFSYDDVPAPGFKRKAGLTTVVGTDRSLAAAWEGMRNRFIRKQIGRGERAGITAGISDDWRGFYRVYRRFRRTSRLPNERLSLLRKRGILITANRAGRVVAGGVFISDGTHVRALVLASERLDAPAERELIGWANRLVIWEAVRFAHASGHAGCDLGGISPESANRQLVSLAEFKESFGGERRTNYYYTRTDFAPLRWWLKVRSYMV